MKLFTFSPYLAIAAAAGALLPACSAGAGSEDGATTQQDDTVGLAGDAGSTDGPPVRKPCTSNFGSGLAGTFGRLDGTIVAVVPTGHGACNADHTHVHLQVLSQGQVYDVAVNIDDGYYAERDVRLPGAPWVEGWHRGGSLDYVADLGLHATDFNTASQSQLEQKVEAELASANHVSIFATLYSHGGVHLVHRSKSGNPVDGAVVLDPLSPKAHLIAFHFSDQSF